MTKNILILGGGFGGLRTLLKLSKKIKDKNEYKLYLIDKKNYHLFTPLLYKIILPFKTKEYETLTKMIKIPYQKIINENIEFINDEVIDIDFLNQSILFKNHKSLNFDYLILALGSEVNDFKIKNLKKYALFFKTLNDAEVLKEKIYKLSNNFKKRIKILIGGAGPTGIELAFEIQNLSKNFDVFIIEANNTILKDLPYRVQNYIIKKLKEKKIQIFTSEIIEKITKDRIFLKSKNFLDYDLFIWTGGSKIPEFLEKLPFELENNRIKVNENLNCLFKEEFNNLKPELKTKIFALGDLIYLEDKKKKLKNVLKAKTALDQGKIIAQNILFQINQIEKNKKYSLKKETFILTFDKKKAVFSNRFLLIKGFFAWLIKGLIELKYLSSIMDFKNALTIWFKGIKLFFKN